MNPDDTPPVDPDDPNGSVLAEAFAAITGPRNGAYGPFPADYGRVAEVFNALTDHTLTPTEACLFMAVMKLCRIAHGYGENLEPSMLRDSFVDAAGYIDGAYQCLLAEGDDDGDNGDDDLAPDPTPDPATTA